MKFLHLSDLHLGKRVHSFSMIEEQKYILNQIPIDSNLILMCGAVDEFVFQYIILKYILKNDQTRIDKYICNDNLRYINWNGCTDSPRTLSYNEFINKLLKTLKIFFYML